MKIAHHRGLSLFALLALSAPVGCDSNEDFESTAELTEFRSGDSYITQDQWICVANAGLGLRSGNPSSTDPWKGPASYAMADDMDPSKPFDIPATWSDRLDATAAQILNFENCAGRVLYMNYGVRPSGESYNGSFHKSSSAASGEVDSFALTNNTTVNEIVVWVAGTIPHDPQCSF